jgi:hypothetical protein
MIKPPRILQVALLALVLAGVATWAWRSFAPAPESAAAGNPPAAGTPAPPAAEPALLVLVTYFTTDVRCPTCLKIEKQTRAAVESGFADELAAGSVRFQSVNFDQPQNKHFIDDYGLAFKTVVVSEWRQGKEVKWEKYDKVWELVGEPDAFAAYLQQGIRSHLKADTDA